MPQRLSKVPVLALFCRGHISLPRVEGNMTPLKMTGASNRLLKVHSRTRNRCPCSYYREGNGGGRRRGGGEP